MTASPDFAAERHAQRERIAELLHGLTPEQWDAPSLCAGWRVRDVVAHITMPFRVRMPELVLGLLTAGFSFNRYADRDARRTAGKLGAGELIGLVERNLDHPWTPPGGGPAGALSHDVIHDLDFSAPLGLPAPPADRIALVLADAGARQLRYFGTDLAGLRLVGSDADIAVGDGPTDLALPARDLLLIVTGRRPVPRA